MASSCCKCRGTNKQKNKTTTTIIITTSVEPVRSLSAYPSAHRNNSDIVYKMEQLHGLIIFQPPGKIKLRIASSNGPLVIATPTNLADPATEFMRTVLVSSLPGSILLQNNQKLKEEYETPLWISASHVLHVDHSRGLPTHL